MITLQEWKKWQETLKSEKWSSPPLIIWEHPGLSRDIWQRKADELAGAQTLKGLTGRRRKVVHVWWSSLFAWTSHPGQFRGYHLYHGWPGHLKTSSSKMAQLPLETLHGTYSRNLRWIWNISSETLRLNTHDKFFSKLVGRSHSLFKQEPPRKNQKPSEMVREGTGVLGKRDNFST